MSEHNPLSSLPLFAPPRPVAPFQVKSSTSRRAGETRSRASVAKKRERVLMIITAAGEEGRSCSEIAGELGCHDHWITSTIAKLLELGAIADSGRERKNPESGKGQRVLVAGRPAA